MRDLRATLGPRAARGRRGERWFQRLHGRHVRGGAGHDGHNFVTCNVRICEIAGRSGEWYGFADTGVNLMFAVGIPGTAWVQRCGAWAAGGPRASGGMTYAGIGFQLAEGATYDLSVYTGSHGDARNQQPRVVHGEDRERRLLRRLASATTGSQTRSLAFSTLTPNAGTVGTLDKSQITEFQFTAEFPSTFGFAIHQVSLY